MTSRSASRLLAVQALYQIDLRGVTVEEALETVAEHHEAPEDVTAFARELLEVTEARRQEIDRLVGEHLAEQWTLGRLGRMELAALRLATAELIRDDSVPTAVILDEALELTRDFGDDKAVSFVNGVLDRLARTVRPKGYLEEPPAGSPAP